MRVRSRNIQLLWVALLLVGCRDTTGLTRPTTSNAPRSITPRILVLSDTGRTALVTLALELSGNVGKLGSFTGRLHFNPSSLDYVGEVAIADGATRAVNRTGDVIRVAGISTSGVNAARLVTFRFGVIDKSALETLRFDLEEVHEISTTNLLSLVRASSFGRMP